MDKTSQTVFYVQRFVGFEDAERLQCLRRMIWTASATASMFTAYDRAEAVQSQGFDLNGSGIDGVAYAVERLGCVL